MDTDAAPVTRVSTFLRIALGLTALATFVAGLPLVTVSSRTAGWFAWTMDDQVTAALLGAGLLAAAVLALDALRHERWVDARIAVPALVVMTSLALAVTIVHLDLLHREAEHGLGARIAAWGWLGAMAVLPLLLVVAAALQRRARDGDAGVEPLPSPLRAALTVLAAVFLPAGAWLLLRTTEARDAWPWTFGEIDARVLGALALMLGVVALTGLLDRWLTRVAAAGSALALAGALGLVAVIRFHADLEWSHVGTLALVVILAVTALTGVLVRGFAVVMAEEQLEEVDETPIPETVEMQVPVGVGAAGPEAVTEPVSTRPPPAPVAAAAPTSWPSSSRRGPRVSGSSRQVLRRGFLMSGMGRRGMGGPGGMAPLGRFTVPFARLRRLLGR